MRVEVGRWMKLGAASCIIDYDRDEECTLCLNSLAASWRV